MNFCYVYDLSTKLIRWINEKKCILVCNKLRSTECKFVINTHGNM